MGRDAFYVHPNRRWDSTTRTAQARALRSQNPGEDLRIDMYVDVEFTSSGRLSGPVVPEAAVQSIGEASVCVFFFPVKNNEGSFQFCVRSTSVPAAGGNYFRHQRTQ